MSIFSNSCDDIIVLLQDRPFFLMMAYDEVHVPLFASNKYRNTVSQTTPPLM